MKPINRLLISLLIAAVIMLSVAFWGIVYAAEIHLQWDANPEPDVAYYKVYMGTQVDMATWAWEQISEVSAPTTELVYDVPTDGLRLFRVSACDEAGMESIRYNAGVFSCPDWMPPAVPSGAGIK